ncbi:MAG: Nif11-like leader peptide family natural product precursor [Actinomycetota bacterium]
MPPIMEALRFIRATRENPDLATRLSELDPDAGLEPVVALAASAGYSISAESLRAAHAQDWMLRWIRYCKAATTVAVVNRASSST